MFVDTDRWLLLWYGWDDVCGCYKVELSIDSLTRKQVWFMAIETLRSVDTNQIILLFFMVPEF